MYSSRPQKYTFLDILGHCVHRMGFQDRTLGGSIQYIYNIQYVYNIHGQYEYILKRLVDLLTYIKKGF